MSKIQPSHSRQDATSDLLINVREEASDLSFPPKNVVRCTGAPIFRTQAARDVGCLLDVDPSVISWGCLPTVLTHRNRHHIPDFVVQRASDNTLIDVVTPLRRPPPAWAQMAAEKLGFAYELRREVDLRGDTRLDNARDLLQYTHYRATLGDRVRIIGLLEEHGSQPLSACLQMVRNSHDAIGVVAALTLRRFIEMDLDEARIGPDTRVSAFRG